MRRPVPRPPSPTMSRSRAVWRLALGVVQIAAAVASVALYATRGPDAMTTAVLSLTAAALVISLLGSRRRELDDADGPPRP